jgi:hypothetical protein
VATSSLCQEISFGASAHVSSFDQHEKQRQRSGIPYLQNDVVKVHCSAPPFSGNVSLNIPWLNEWSGACFLNQSIVLCVLTQVEILDEAGMIRRLQEGKVACERTWWLSSRWAFH